MSAGTSSDVARIEDEEVLRKMWQDTDDFAKKKEIRSHMYKLREERLRNFYSSSDSEIQRAHTSSSFLEKTTKGGNGPTHADSLADHSFLSLKSKEIRDSESPTREMHYRITDQGRVKDQGWDIVAKAETSRDRKTHATSRLATTAGTENIQGGVATYAGKCEQKTSDYSDGDANNFTKSSAANINTALVQEASGGDANSSFKSFSSSSSSSSKFVSQHKSTNENVTERALPPGDSLVVKTYTTDVPPEYKNSPNYIDGKTRVTTETRTLPDGSRVTTTRYETRGAKTQSSTDRYSSEQVVSEQTSSTAKSSTTKTHKTIQDETSRGTVQEKYVPVDVADKLVTMQSVKSSDVNQDTQNVHASSSVKVTKSHVQESRGFDVNVESNRADHITDKTISHKVTDTSRKEDVRTSQDHQDDVRTMQVIKEQKYTLRDDYPQQTKVVKSQDTEKRIPATVAPKEGVTPAREIVVYDDRNVSSDKVAATLDDSRTSFHKEVVTSKQSLVTKTNEKIHTDMQDDVHVKRVIQEKEYVSGEKQSRDTTPYDTPQPGTPALRTPGDQTPVTSTPVPHDVRRPQPETPYVIQTTVTRYTDDTKDNRKTTDDFINTERVHVQDTQPKQREPAHCAPEKREPIRPGKSELDERPKPTEGQYSTTYRTDYVNRRISVEVSPTHDAFARSLRAVSPDRDKKRASTRSLKSSTSSLRSSTSPEKAPADRRFPCRTSPERKYGPDSRGSSPTKRTTPDKYTPERISSPRTSPSKYSPSPVNSDTLTKKRTTTVESHVATSDRKQTDSSTLTRRSKTRPRSRSASPTSIASDIEYVRPSEMVTDLDDETSSTITNNFKKQLTETRRISETIQDKRPTSLNVTTKKTRKITDRSPTSPLTELKDKPSEKPLKRRDTYEDRCRQILGISDKTTIDVKSVEIKKTKSKVDEVTVSPKRSPSKATSPAKDFKEYKSPNKPSPSGLKEFPSQIRRTPEKEPLQRPPEKRRPSKEQPTIQEFPSQIRRTPDKHSPNKKPKEVPTLQETTRSLSRSKERIVDQEVHTRKTTEIKEYPSQKKSSPEREIPRKINGLPYGTSSPEKELPREKGRESPSYPSRSPDKQFVTEKTKQIQEFSSRVEEKDIQHTLATKDVLQVQEFPSQIRKSPEKQVPTPGKEFPGQQRRTPERDSPQMSKKPYFLTETPKATSDTPKIQEFPSQIRRSPERDLGSPKGGSESPTTEPLFSRKSVDLLCREDEVKRTDLHGSIYEPGDEVGHDRPHKTLKKDSPERTPQDLPRRSPEPKRLVSDTFIQKERFDTDITIRDSGKPLYQTGPKDKSPARSSPDRTSFTSETVSLSKLTDISTSTVKRGRSEERQSPVRSDKSSPIRSDRSSPIRSDRSSPVRTVTDKERKVTKTGTTEYIDEYCTPTKPKQSTSITEKKITERNNQINNKTNKVVKTKPVDVRKPEKNDKVIVNATQTRTKETIKIITNGDTPKRGPSTGKPKPSHEPTGYLPQRPKTEKVSPKTTIKSTSVANKRDEKITYSVEKVYNIDRVKDVKITNGDISKTYKPRKPDERKPITQQKPEPTKIPYSSTPERKGPFRPSDKENVQTSECIRKTTVKMTVKETKPKPDSPAKPTQKQRHVVTTTIQVVPKVKEAPKKTPQKVGKVTPTTDKSKPQIKPGQIKPRKPTENGHITTEDDSEIDQEVIEVIDTNRMTERVIKTTSRTDQKLTRTTSDQIIKTKKTPTRGFSKPELISSPKPETEKPTKKPKKVITTKSIVINNDLEDEKEIVINLQRSTSSREPTPDQVYPRPASEDEDTGIPRYPDQIYEPDEPVSRKKPTRLSDIPIIETEDVAAFSRITEIATERVDKVDETDECLLSVNQKVNKFVDEAEKLTKPSSPSRKSPPLDQRERIRDNKIVSEKVSKFTNAHLATNQDLPERPKSPRCRYFPEDETVQEYPSVSEKVSHFIETAEKVKHSQKPKDGPTPKGYRPNLQTNETIITSDSNKFTKFTAAQVRQDTVSLSKMEMTPKKQPSPTRESPRRESPRRDSPRRESPTGINNESVQIETKEQTYTRKSSLDRYSVSREHSPLPEEKTPRSSPRPTSLAKDKKETKYPRKSSLKDIDSTPKSSRVDGEPKSILSPTGRLRSTESIRRAKELFENIAKEQRSPRQRDIISRPSVLDHKQKPYKPTDGDVKLTDIGIYRGETDKTHKTFTYTDDTLKSTRLVMDKLGSKSPDNIDSPHYLQPLDRSPRPHSPYQNRSASPRPPSPARERSPRPHSPSLDEMPHYMWPLDRTLREHSPESEVRRSRDPTPDRKLSSRGSTPDRILPSYMKSLDRQVRPKSPTSKADTKVSHKYDHNKSTKFGVGLKHTDTEKRRQHSPESEVRRSPTPDRKLSSRGSTPDRNLPSYMKSLDRHVRPKSPSPKGDAKVSHKYEHNKSTKFGVGLKHTDTEKTSQRKKITIAEIERILTTEDVEEIYDLEILEILLERALSYEHRRKIRSQIRIVKQLISENKLETVLNKKKVYKTKDKSPEKFAVHDRKPIERHTEYSSKESRAYHQADSSQQERRSSETYSYSERKTSSEFRKEVRKSASPEPKSRERTPEKDRASPNRSSQKEAKSVFKTELRRTAPVTKTVVEEKPVWVTQRPLKKATERTSSSTSTTIVKKQTSRASPAKERKSEDTITSSYGVGPTDENGSPLFGLKALRAHNRTDTTKVQGTVIRSHYYSENGQEPVGQISVTKYSTDPRDLDGHTEDRNGLVSVTTTRKFPAKGSPSTKAITDRKSSTDEEVVKTKSTTVSRRGSVKEMSKKFIENAVETSKSERQSSYPKAGLILRSSSFKDTARGSRESSPEKQETVKRVVVEKTVVSGGANTESFLSNRTRVTGVQDVITRMKNADEFQDGDSVEDREAKALLNKFIGSQVILSGMEARSSSSQSPVTTIKRTTTTTTTTSKGGGKPTVTTRTFTHPISEADLATVWDEQTLKLLLERSTDYEERQIIRARIRDAMAEKEVCADATAQAKDAGGRVEEPVETKSAAEGTLTTTKVTTSTTSQQVTKKPVSPFAKFRQLDKQNSLNTPPGTPKTPTGSRPLFKFTDPEVGRQASTVKERLLQWCQMKTKEYENINLENFSTSWADGLAFCALIHHFLPDAFDYHALTPKERRHNFSLAFRIADEKANIMPLLDVDDMVATRKPDWKCVFTYVQTIYSRFKNED